MNLQILLDLDGLLADFSRAAVRAHGRELEYATMTWDFPVQMGFESAVCPKFWAPLENPEFWASLPPLPDGMALLDRLRSALGVGHLGVCSNAGIPGSPEGKKRWLRQHAPDLVNRASYLTDKHVLAAPCKLLLDDRCKNCDAFAAAGGRAWLAPRPWNRRRELETNGLFDVARAYDEVMAEFELMRDEQKLFRQFRDRANWSPAG